MEVIQLEKHPDLIKVIQKNYSKLSKGQKIIANYIINDYDKAAFMTAAKLGETLNISESTVVRFSIKLGYDGYRDLQNQLQELIKNKLTTLQRLDLADSDYDTNLVSSGPNDVFEQLLKVNSNDVIIIITYPRYSKRTLEVLNYVKEKGATIIAITDSFLSPATEMSDVSLIASSEMLSFVDSLVAPMSLINSLIVSLGIEKRNELNSYFQELEEIWKRYNIYKEDI
jgi:DNA-binding MurR/RpiR family transcriptional regulator